MGNSTARELIIIGPDNKTQTVTVSEGPVSLGRAHSNQLCYPDDASLSRNHLSLEFDGESWTVRDLDSKNHTFVNGTRVDSAKLARGDRITAGRLTMVFDDPRAKSPEQFQFYATDEKTPPLNTVMTSLGGVLSGEASGPGTPGVTAPVVEPTDSGASFRSPVVTALIRAGRELMGHQPLDELFKLILDLSIETVGAERGMLMTNDGGELLIRANRGKGFRISTAVRDKVLQEKNSVLVRDAQQEDDFKDRRSIIDQQIRTMMAVPLQTDERVIGLIYVDSRFFVRDFNPDDLSLLTVLANVAAIRIEHQRLLEIERVERQLKVEMEQAARVQQRILPAGAPALANLDLAGHNAACRTVGGDYYDFLEYPDGRVGLALGDVAGKGMPAALLMCTLQAQVRVLAEQPENLSDLIARLDRSVSANCPRNRFITLFFGVLDSTTGELRYCNAGHNPPLLIRADGSAEHLPVGGTVLGIMPELGYEERSCRMEPGDLLAIFSDGVTEAVNPREEEFGEDRLAALLREHREKPASEIVDLVNAATLEWTEGAPPADDITLVVARRTG